jgi:cell pole-organizing protein PopZ
MSTMKYQSESDAVLSSVRRIVTRETQAAVAGAANGVVEKLLLTPALRVDTPPVTPISAAQRREPSALELRIAELERAVSGQPGDWEPDGSEGVDAETPKEFVFRHGGHVTTSATRSEAPAETYASEETSDSARVLSAEVAPAPLRLDSAEIDEDQLREIVAQMIRTELQGALGERITQNVRKLVRREIHRALLTRDLD